MNNSSREVVSQRMKDLVRKCGIKMYNLEIEKEVDKGIPPIMLLDYGCDLFASTKAGLLSNEIPVISTAPPVGGKVFIKPIPEHDSKNFTIENLAQKRNEDING